jgi:hypothetical protein
MITEDILNSSIHPLNNPRRRSCSLTSIRELLKIIAQVLIPLMLGAFTVVIAFQQHNLGKENRQKDFEINEQDRKQELALRQY